jgi:RNA polymerase primary sigma factor
VDCSVRKLHPLLRLAVISGVEAALEIHIRRGDDLDARDGDGATPLILAAVRKKKGVVRRLIEAGTDLTLVDPNGMDALAHATASGCAETITLLTAALARISDTHSESPNVTRTENRESTLESAFDAVSEFPRESSYGAIAETPWQAAKPYFSETREKDHERPTLAGGKKFDQAEINILSLDDEPLDVGFEGDWEAEEDAIAPEGDNSVAEAARQVHETIERYKPIDGYEGWSDIDLHLPDRAMPLKTEDGDGAVRALLLAALRDGLIAEGDLIDACSDIDGTRDAEAERILGFVATELGATVVAWAGQESPSWGEPSPEEEQLLNEATEFRKELGSRRNDPLRFYTREIRNDRLTAEEEIALAGKIEEAGRAAMVTLANWPEGLAVLFDAAAKVARGEENAKAFSFAIETPHDDEPTFRTDIFDQNEDDDEDASTFVSTVAAARAAAGDARACAEALGAVRLTHRFLVELAALAQRDPAGTDFIKALERQSFARDRMILCNLRLALSIAKKYLRSGVPLDDLVQEANIGLMKAVERYDGRRGFRFSTYATWWIRQQVSRSIADTAKVVRAPVHIQETARKVIREREAVEAKLGRLESDVETAQRIGMSPSKTSLLLSMFDDAESLDEFDPETGMARVDLLIEPRASDPAEIAARIALHAALVDMLDECGERPQAVITLRFGLGGEDALTLEDVGQRFGVTRERIRQIEAKALLKLSLPSRKLILAPFLGETAE